MHEVLSKYYELREESRTLESLHEIFRGIMTDLIAEEKKVLWRSVGGKDVLDCNSPSSLGLRST